MDPYRTMPVDDAGEAPRDTGIVGDVIAQFADPNAFYRELVQNSIDAGSPTVEVRLDYDGDARLLRVSVRDRGDGMTRDILENQLLVLFRSTKEGDHSKIGKFGIGFASVLAPNPDVVIVDTVRDGKRLTLHLQRDLTYKLFDTGAATRTGTTVTLEVAMAAEQVDAFATASEVTLVRWCRHATVPIELTVARGGATEPTTVRIDRPLALEGALVSVRGEDGELVAIVGILDTPTPYVGFFNHGLTLYETTDPLVGRFAVKLQDSRLGHTLSRDNVRRDAAFTRALAFAHGLVAHELPIAAAGELRRVADADDVVAYRALVTAIVASGLHLPLADWSFPLVEAVGGRRSIDASAFDARVWASARASELTAVLARSGEPVLHVAPGDGGWLAAHLLAIADCQLVDVARELTCVTPVGSADADAAADAAADVALGAMLATMFAQSGRAPASIALATLTGAHADALAIAGRHLDADTDTGEAGAGVARAYVVDRDQAAISPFGRLRRPPLVVNAAHVLVRAARTADDVRLAASHLARAVLLQYRLLDVARSTALLAHTLDALGIGIGIGGDGDAP